MSVLERGLNGASSTEESKDLQYQGQSSGEAYLVGGELGRGNVWVSPLVGRRAFLCTWPW